MTVEGGVDGGGGVVCRGTGPALGCHQSSSTQIQVPMLSHGAGGGADGGYDAWALLICSVHDSYCASVGVLPLLDSPSLDWSSQLCNQHPLPHSCSHDFPLLGMLTGVTPPMSGTW